MILFLVHGGSQRETAPHGGSGIAFIAEMAIRLDQRQNDPGAPAVQRIVDSVIARRFRPSEAVAIIAALS
jgi:hypothetical protein